jgi:hypothetical protein
MDRKILQARIELGGSYYGSLKVIPMTPESRMPCRLFQLLCLSGLTLLRSWKKGFGKGLAFREYLDKYLSNRVADGSDQFFLHLAGIKCKHTKYADTKYAKKSSHLIQRSSVTNREESSRNSTWIGISHLRRSLGCNRPVSRCL